MCDRLNTSAGKRYPRLGARRPELTLREFFDDDCSCNPDFVLDQIANADTPHKLASFPGSPPPFLFFVGARGEPGNEATHKQAADSIVALYAYGTVESGDCDKHL